ncbi:MAG: heparinase II/III domain-containing protein [Pirellulaceae bacterium]
MAKRLLIVTGIAWALFSPPWQVAGESPRPPQPPLRKTAGALYPPELIARARKNAQTYGWAAQARDGIVAAAQPWVQMSDQELWDLMFSANIRRSWMVWSNGHCPACRKPVPMYEWIANALEHPWKMQCPQCNEFFPKNDFQKFYRSGLNEQGVFEPARADRSLLFNVEHPDASDPLHTFGVDDGDGYIAGEDRWRFIGAYLIYGQWKQAIVNGVRRLADAYLVSGDTLYAHKAGVLLDRIADLYPTFDFGKEGVMYEGPPSAGYVSTWHDACVEVHDLALAYDAVFEAISRDEALIAFLAAKAEEHQLTNRKASFTDIQHNIEERILRDTVVNRRKIESNYPTTDITIATILTVLEWPGNRDEVTTILDQIIRQATAVDGLSGEKGIAGYSTIAPRTVAELLGRYGRMEAGFLASAFERHPQLHAMYRFHVDTWCLGMYYPNTGDTGAFGQKCASYAPLNISRNANIAPSAFTFLWDLYTATGDNDFVRVLYAANGHSTDGLPYDLFSEDPGKIQQAVAAVIEKEGPAIRSGSINKAQWCLAILRSGAGEDARAAWLDYDSGGGHGHADALNLGLFAKGLDLMPDFGYPPVQYGGWGAPRAAWYTQTAAHNTVVVDGQNTQAGSGTTTAWADGQQCRLVCATAASLIGGQQYERTVALIDSSEPHSYVVDLFRIVGGREHTKFMHSHFGQITADRLSLQPVTETIGNGQMRNFRQDLHPPAVWSVDWTIEDHLQYLPPATELHLRYTDLTADAEVLTAEGWVAVGLYGGTADAWIPRVMVRRRAEQAPLASTFVGIIEPYEDQPRIASVRRLALESDDEHAAGPSDIALEICLTDGRRDVLVATDIDNPLRHAPSKPGVFVERATGIRIDGQLGFVRFDASGKPLRVMLCQGRLLEVGTVRLERTQVPGWVEVDLRNQEAPIVSGAPLEVKSLSDGVRSLWPR